MISKYPEMVVNAVVVIVRTRRGDCNGNNAKLYQSVDIESTKRFECRSDVLVLTRVRVTARASRAF